MTKGLSTMLSRRPVAIAVIAVIVVLGLGLGLLRIMDMTRPKQFSGTEAFKHIETQMAFGPRPPGSDANRKTSEYILDRLESLRWQTETQEFTYHDVLAQNVIGRAAVGQGPVLIIGAHYDTRWNADQDPASPASPVPGANDGASGVAVLLELARVLEVRSLNHEIWLAFFDAEDNGNIGGWDWIVGSTHMAENLTVTPQAMILVDMVGDADQQIYYDANSNQALSAQLFQIAADLGYSAHFIPQTKYAMLDDHTPFANRGIPAVDLIDFDYPYWHTTQDTSDKISPASLERVGRIIETFLEQTP